MFTFCLLTHICRTMTLFPEAAQLCSSVNKRATLASKTNRRRTEQPSHDSSSVQHNENTHTEKDQQDVFCSPSERACLVLVDAFRRKQISPRQRSFPEEQHSRMTFHRRLKIEETTLPTCVRNQPLLRGRHQNRSDSKTAERCNATNTTCLFFLNTTLVSMADSP